MPQDGQVAESLHKGIPTMGCYGSWISRTSDQSSAFVMGTVAVT